MLDCCETAHNVHTQCPIRGGGGVRTLSDDAVGRRCLDHFDTNPPIKMLIQITELYSQFEAFSLLKVNCVKQSGTSLPCQFETVRSHSLTRNAKSKF